jgi:hypothetical protein
MWPLDFATNRRQKATLVVLLPVYPQDSPDIGTKGHIGKYPVGDFPSFWEFHHFGRLESGVNTPIVLFQNRLPLLPLEGTVNGNLWIIIYPHGRYIHLDLIEETCALPTLSSVNIAKMYTLAMA